MRQLFLLRHAKAAPSGAAPRDHDRPLTQRGQRDAAAIGRFLTATGWAPDLVLTSTAIRARTTAESAIEAGGWRCPLRETPDLYQSSIERSLDVVRACGSRGGTVLLVGHEPTWSTLTGFLIGSARLRLPTAGLALVDFDLDDWAEVAPGAGVLRGLVIPAMLEGIPSGAWKPGRSPGRT